jgi:hypothetical protein
VNFREGAWPELAFGIIGQELDQGRTGVGCHPTTALFFGPRGIELPPDATVIDSPPESLIPGQAVSVAGRQPEQAFSENDKLRVMCAAQGACVPRRSWTGYTINLFEFEFLTETATSRRNCLPFFRRRYGKAGNL